MKRVRNLAGILFYISRITSWVLIIVGGYVLITILLHVGGIKGLPIEINNSYFVILLPFSKQPFLLGDYTAAYLSVSLSVMILYAIFLWLLSAVFKMFKQQKIFIPTSVRHLQNFYRFNFYIPVLYVLCLVIFKLELKDAVVIVLLHLMLSVFIYFMATIFQQGLVLQEEQDQTL